jgi:orotate phosphoribosyltransferase
MSHHLIRQSTVKTYLIKKIKDFDALRSGEFKLNSEVVSEYYYDFSRFNNSLGLAALGFIISKTIQDLNLEFDVLMGTAYKGIILCLAANQEMFRATGRNVEWVFDRKELKDHGEGGQLVGADITNKRVLLVDDVVTSGKALQRSVNTTMKYQPKSVECLVLVDRSEIKLPFKLHTVLSHQEALTLLTKRA